MIATFKTNMRRRLRQRWQGGLASILTVTCLALVLLYLMPRRNNTSNLPIDTKGRPVVVLRQGKIIGVELDAGYPQVLEAFRGVPYGQSTAGSQRFAAPLPVLESKDDFDASEFGDKCPGGNDGRQSEDCLNANIYRPRVRDVGKKIPVVIHFHGGAFNFGSGDASRHLASFVAWAGEPLIAVGFNYRIGAFGFLAGGFMAKEGLLNAGLRDQVLMMEWVRDNIAAFGGDPDCVSIMGSSAGAHSIGHHILHNPSIRPLFHRAILESGAPTARAVYTHSNPLNQLQFLDLVKALNLQKTPESNLLSELRSVTTNQLKAASEAVFNKYNPSIRWPFQPVIEGPSSTPISNLNPLIPNSPISALQASKFHKIPILLGYNTNEGAMFVPQNINTNAEFTSFFHELLPGLLDADLEKLADVYPDPNTDPSSPYLETRKGLGLGKQFLRTEQAYGQFAYIAPVRMLAGFMSGSHPGMSKAAISVSKKGQSDPKWEGENVYLYHFAPSSSVKGGADHGSHIPWVNYSPERRDMGDAVDEVAGCMHAYWSSFVLTGDPNAVPGRWADRAKWPLYKQGGEDGRGRARDGKLLVFGEGNDIIAGGSHGGVGVQVKDDGFAQKESEFWWARTGLFEF